DPSRYFARCRRPLGLPPDLLARHLLDRLRRSPTRELPPLLVARPRVERRGRALAVERCRRVDAGPDRKSVVQGKRGDLGGRRIIKKNTDLIGRAKGRAQGNASGVGHNVKRLTTQ